MFEKVLLAVGGQDATEPARLAAGLCRQLGSRLTIVSVYPATSRLLGEPDYSDHLIARQAEADKALERASDTVQGEGLTDEPELERLEGDPAGRIIEFAVQLGFDLIVMGTRRRGRLGAALLGSVSHAVAAGARVPVLVVPERPAGQSGGA